MEQNSLQYEILKLKMAGITWQEEKSMKYSVYIAFYKL